MMRIRTFQKGFHFAQDGPGNRLVYHLQGCNMRCPWCSNPEGMAVSSAACREQPVEEVIREVLSARPMFFEGGGLTLTGGEVTMQLEAVRALLSAVREAGVHTAIETNATHPALPSLMECIDLLIADVKHPDDALHRRHTGVGNGQVLRNLESVALLGAEVLLRIPFIHGVNDDDGAVAGFLRFFERLKAAPRLRVEILRYHEYGKDKWAACGMEYAMRDAFVDEARAEWLEERIRALSIEVVRT